jgi:hypothetical protein
MCSPYVALLGLDPSGKLTGKDRLREYWSLGLKKRPDLKFALRAVFCGADSIALFYDSNISGRCVVETLTFNSDGKVKSAHAYSEIS